MNTVDSLAKYIRLSLEDGDIDFAGKAESNSVVNQRRLLDGYIETHEDLRDMPVMEFVDDGKSGTNFQRSGFQSLMYEIKRGKVKAVIVKDFSRFGRSYIEVSDYLEQIFPFLGVRFISVNDRYDSKQYSYGSAGMIDVGFKQIMHQYYSTSLSQKLLNTKRQLFKSGKFHSCFAFYGYRKSSEKYKLEIEEETAAVVRLIFDLCVQGKSTAQIAAQLNAAQYPTPLAWLRKNHAIKGWNAVSEHCTWTSEAVRRILADERYTGKCIYGKTRVEKIGGKRCIAVPPEEWVVVPDRFPAIIPQEIYDRAQQTRKRLCVDQPKKKSSRPLMAKVRCGHCGYAMRYHEGNHAYYQCDRYQHGANEECARTRVYERDLTALVLHSLKMQAAAFYRETQKADRKGGMDSMKKKMKSLQARLKRIPLQIEQNYSQMLDGSISEAENERLYMELKKEEAAYRAELNHLEEAVQLSAADEKRAAFHAVLLEDMMHVEDLTGEQVDSCIRSINIFKDDRIEIRWNFSSFCDTMNDSREDMSVYILPSVCGKRVWLYCRTQKKDDRFYQQKRLLHQYAAEKEWSVVGASYDIGSNTDMERKGLSEVLSAAQSGKFDVLLIKNMDKISRDASAADRYIRCLQENNVRVTAVDGMLLYPLLQFGGDFQTAFQNGGETK